MRRPGAGDRPEPLHRTGRPGGPRAAAPLGNGPGLYLSQLPGRLPAPDAAGGAAPTLDRRVRRSPPPRRLPHTGEALEPVL